MAVYFCLYANAQAQNRRGAGQCPDISPEYMYTLAHRQRHGSVDTLAANTNKMLIQRDSREIE